MRHEAVKRGTNERTSEHPFRTRRAEERRVQLAVIRFRDFEISICPLLSVHLPSVAHAAPAAPLARQTAPPRRSRLLSRTSKRRYRGRRRRSRRLGIGLLEPLNTRTQLGEKGDGETPGFRTVPMDGVRFREGPIWSGSLSP